MTAALVDGNVLIDEEDLLMSRRWKDGRAHQGGDLAMGRGKKKEDWFYTYMMIVGILNVITGGFMETGGIL